MTGKPISQQSRRKVGLLFGILFSSVFLFSGLGVGWFMYLRPAIQGRQALASWQRVPCVILSSKVGVHHSDDGSTYSIEISYQYPFNGSVYQSNRFGFFGGSSSGYDEKAAVVARYAQGSRATCYVNPAKPSQAVLEPHSTAPMIFIFLPIAFVAVGGLMTLAFVYAAVRGERPPPGQRAGDADRPLHLRAGKARAKRFLGITFFALFWNGILAPIAWHVLGSSNHIAWLIGLFLIPFALAGVGLLIACGYYGLALLNPRVAVTLSRGAVGLGETVDVRWTMAGRYDRVRRLKIYLEGREQATYRRGTSTATDKHVFARFDLIDTDAVDDIRSGGMKLTMPADSVPTFHAANNKVLWVLVVRGEIPNWPDVKDEFEIHVIAPKSVARAPATSGAAAPGAEAPGEGSQELAIEISGRRAAFAPRESVSGTFRWQLTRPARWIEGRLFWFTRGKGTMDVAIVDRTRFETPDHQDKQTFRFTLPDGPYTFSGRLISVIWAIELIAEPGDRNQRVEIVVAPGGHEVLLGDARPVGSGT